MSSIPLCGTGAAYVLPVSLGLILGYILYFPEYILYLPVHQKCFRHASGESRSISEAFLVDYNI
jgi:hypothetical protein